MTDGSSLSDAAALWYSRGNPTHLHCPIRPSTPFFSLLFHCCFSLNMCWLLHGSASQSVLTHLCAAEPKFGKYFGIIEQWQLHFQQINPSKYKHTGFALEIALLHFVFVLFFQCKIITRNQHRRASAIADHKQEVVVVSNKRQSGQTGQFNRRVIWAEWNKQPEQDILKIVIPVDAFSTGPWGLPDRSVIESFNLLTQLLFSLTWTKIWMSTSSHKEFVFIFLFIYLIFYLFCRVFVMLRENIVEELVRNLKQVTDLKADKARHLNQWGWRNSN